MTIKIQSTDDIINFIKDYPNLDFMQYAEILNQYAGMPIFWDEGSSKQDIIAFIINNRAGLDQSRPQLPLFGNSKVNQ